MKQITFNQYRKIDLFILCILTVIFEVIATLATNKWFFVQAMSISITLTMTCITMFRWGKYALLPSFLGALVYCILTGGTMAQFIAYCGGSLFCVVAFPLLLKFGLKETRLDFVKKTIFVIVTYISIVLGRWLLSLLFDFSFSSLIVFLTTDILSLLFAVIVVSIAKNVDGLIEDQKSYLIRLDEESKKEQQANLNDPF